MTRGQCLARARQGTQAAQPKLGRSLAFRRGRWPTGLQPEATPPPWARRRPAHRRDAPRSGDEARPKLERQLPGLPRTCSP
eukprot:12669005-Alexandrium_andersonii.AAC.1